MVKGQRVSGTFDTKAAALAWEAQQRVELRDDLGMRRQNSLKTCSEAFDKYHREVSAKKRGKRWEGLRLAAFKTEFGDRLMASITPADLAAWRDKRLLTVTGSTVNRDMNLLSNVFTVARKEWGWVGESPTKDVKRPKESPPRDRRISQAEIDAIRLTLGWPVDVSPTLKSHRVAIAFLFALETAMRAGEVCRLKPVDVSGRVARLRLTKNGYDRDVPLSPRAIELWAFVPDGFGLDPDKLSALFSKARTKAGIPDLNFHDSRHEAITRLAAKLHVLDLARMVGHRDIRQLQSYYNATADQIADKLA